MKIKRNVRILLDIGGGKYDTNKLWLQNKYSNKLTVHVIDPFLRSQEHNEKVQQMVLLQSGADIVTSLSVLNVICDVHSRLTHISTVHDALKFKGVAYFKIWAGMYPLRGTNIAYHDENRGVYQANAWAKVFKEEVEFVFKEGNVFVDNAKNLIIAIKN